MNKKLLIIPCLVLAGCQNANSNSTNTGEKEIVPVVMLIGQSNASGTSWSSYLSNHFDQKTINQYRSGFDKVQIAHQCEGFSGNNTPDGEFVSVKLGQGYDQQHFGPEVGMAEYLTKNYGKNIYIIKWAYGGTGLATDWKSPSFSGGNNGWCYDGFVNFAKDSIKALSTKYRVEVKAFCWMQGEEDSVHDEYTKTYGNYLSMFISDLRKEFKKYQGESGIGFIDAAITKAWTNYRLINQAKLSVANTYKLNFYLSEAEDLPFNKEPDDIADIAHLDSDGMISLGHMFAKSLIDNFLDK